MFAFNLSVSQALKKKKKKEKRNISRYQKSVLEGTKWIFSFAQKIVENFRFK